MPAGLTYKVVVSEINDRGQGEAYTSPVFTKESSAIASAPRSVTATSRSANQVSVAWDAPATDGGKAVTEYDVVIEDGSNGGYGRWASFPGSARSGTITGVRSGTWPIKVVANNANGASPVGLARVTVAGPSSAPGAPVAPRTSPVTKGGKATITWKAPKAVAGAPVIRYAVTVDGRQFSTKARTLKVSGLRAGPAKVIVRAVSKKGTSKATTLTVKVKKSVAQAPKPTLRPGQSGTAVKKMQRALGVKASGSFSKSTKAALVRWQKAHHVSATGVASDRVRYLLNI
jgi:hypothetical protein